VRLAQRVVMQKDRDFMDIIQLKPASNKARSNHSVSLNPLKAVRIWNKFWAVAANDINHNKVFHFLS